MYSSVLGNGISFKIVAGSALGAIARIRKTELYNVSLSSTLATLVVPAATSYTVTVVGQNQVSEVVLQNIYLKLFTQFLQKFTSSYASNRIKSFHRNCSLKFLKWKISKIKLLFSVSEPFDYRFVII